MYFVEYLLIRLEQKQVVFGTVSSRDEPDPPVDLDELIDGISSVNDRLLHTSTRVWPGPAQMRPLGSGHATNSDVQFPASQDAIFTHPYIAGGSQPQSHQKYPTTNYYDVAPSPGGHYLSSAIMNMGDHLPPLRPSQFDNQFQLLPHGQPSNQNYQSPLAVQAIYSPQGADSSQQRHYPQLQPAYRTGAFTAASQEIPETDNGQIDPWSGSQSLESGVTGFDANMFHGATVNNPGLIPTSQGNTGFGYTNYGDPNPLNHELGLATVFDRNRSSTGVPSPPFSLFPAIPQWTGPTGTASVTSHDPELIHQDFQPVKAFLEWLVFMCVSPDATVPKDLVDKQAAVKRVLSAITNGVDAKAGEELREELRECGAESSVGRLDGVVKGNCRRTKKGTELRCEKCPREVFRRRTDWK